MSTLYSKPYSSDDVYSIEEVKNNFYDYISEKAKESIQNEVSEDLIMPLRAGRFAYFSANQKANMPTYQDNFYSSFNPSYANFTNYDGDCTNYVSQVLRAGGAPMKTSSSTGISGSGFWFYRSSRDRSNSWTGVNELRSFLLNNTSVGPAGYLSSTFGALDTGSIIQLKSSGSSDYYHSVMVYKKGGDPWVTAHTGPYSGYFSSRYGGIQNVKIRIDGYYY